MDQSTHWHSLQLLISPSSIVEALSPLHVTNYWMLKCVIALPSSLRIVWKVIRCYLWRPARVLSVAKCDRSAKGLICRFILGVKTSHSSTGRAWAAHQWVSRNHQRFRLYTPAPASALNRPNLSQQCLWLLRMKTLYFQQQVRLSRVHWSSPDLGPSLMLVPW